MQQNELPEGKSIRRNCSMDELQQEQFTKALLGLVDLAKTKQKMSYSTVRLMMPLKDWNLPKIRWIWYWSIWKSSKN